MASRSDPRCCINRDPEFDHAKQGRHRGGQIGGRTGVLWVGPTARGSSFQAVTKRADRERETRLREPSMGKDDQHRIGKAEGGVTLEVMRPRPMAGNAQA